MSNAEGMTVNMENEGAKRLGSDVAVSPFRRFGGRYAALAVSISSVYLPKRALLLHHAR
jgi:hypothetical protein